MASILDHSAILYGCFVLAGAGYETGRYFHERWHFAVPWFHMAGYRHIGIRWLAAGSYLATAYVIHVLVAMLFYVAFRKLGGVGAALALGELPDANPVEVSLFTQTAALVPGMAAGYIYWIMLVATTFRQLVKDTLVQNPAWAVGSLHVLQAEPAQSRLEVLARAYAFTATMMGLPLKIANQAMMRYQREVEALEEQQIRSIDGWARSATSQVKPHLKSWKVFESCLARTLDPEALRASIRRHGFWRTFMNTSAAVEGLVNKEAKPKSPPGKHPARGMGRIRVSIPAVARMVNAQENGELCCFSVDGEHALLTFAAPRGTPVRDSRCSVRVLSPAAGVLNVRGYVRGTTSAGGHTHVVVRVDSNDRRRLFRLVVCDLRQAV